MREESLPCTPNIPQHCSGYSGFVVAEHRPWPSLFLEDKDCLMYVHKTIYLCIYIFICIYIDNARQCWYHPPTMKQKMETFMESFLVTALRFCTCSRMKGRKISLECFMK